MTTWPRGFKLPQLPPMPLLPVRKQPPRPRGFGVKKTGPKTVAPMLTTEWHRLPAIPEGFLGTLPEWLVYWALNKLGFHEGEDFTFQSSQMGVRWEAGAAVVDFLIFTRLPPLVIRVQGMYWHYAMGSGKQATDELQREELTEHGFEVVDIDEDDANRDPIYYTQRALDGVDLSSARMRGT